MKKEGFSQMGQTESQSVTVNNRPGIRCVNGDMGFKPGIRFRDRSCDLDFAPQVRDRNFSCLV